MYDARIVCSAAVSKAHSIGSVQLSKDRNKKQFKKIKKKKKSASMPVFSKLLLPPPLLLLLQLLKIYISLSLILQLPLLHLPSLLIHKPILLFVEPSSLLRVLLLFLIESSRAVLACFTPGFDFRVCRSGHGCWLLALD